MKDSDASILIGNGLVASAFMPFLRDTANAVFFASGVSNSSEKDEAKFLREETLLDEVIKKNSAKKLIYFSTVSVQDPMMMESAYVKFKLGMEVKISHALNDFLIVRSPNIVGRGGNPNTLVNYFANHENTEIKLWKNTERNFLCANDFARVVLRLIKPVVQKEITQVVHPHSYSPEEVLRLVENTLGVRKSYELIDKGEKYVSPVSDELLSIFERLKIDTSKAYLERVIRKYYGNQ